MSKIDYKSLPDATGLTSVITIGQLAEKFSAEPVKISKIIREAGIAPVGKMPQIGQDGKPKVGKPTLAFDANEAVQAVQSVIGVENKDAA